MQCRTTNAPGFINIEFCEPLSSKGKEFSPLGRSVMLPVNLCFKITVILLCVPLDCPTEAELKR